MGNIFGCFSCESGNNKCCDSPQCCHDKCESCSSTCCVFNKIHKSTSKTNIAQI